MLLLFSLATIGAGLHLATMELRMLSDHKMLKASFNSAAKAWPTGKFVIKKSPQI